MGKFIFITAAVGDYKIIEIIKSFELMIIAKPFNAQSLLTAIVKREERTLLEKPKRRADRITDKKITELLRVRLKFSTSLNTETFV